MAGGSTSVYEFDSMVRGQHTKVHGLYSLTNTYVKCILREDNEHDKYGVINRL